MRFLALFAVVVMSGCFFIPSTYTETVECWDCGELATGAAPAKTAPPVSAPLPSPFDEPVATPAKVVPAKAPVKTVAESLKLRPSPYGETTSSAPSKTVYDVVKTVRVEFENGGTVILNNFDAHNPNPPTPPLSKARRTKRPAGKRLVKAQRECEYSPNSSPCPEGCIPEEFCW